MCSPSRKPVKGDLLSNRFIRRARERVTENRDSSNVPFQGLRSAKKGSRKLRHVGVATCYEKRGKTQPKDGRRRKTTVSQPTVSKITTQYQAGEKKKAEFGNRKFAAYVRKRGELNQWLVRWSKYQHNNAYNRADQKQDKMKSQLKEPNPEKY